MYTYHFFSEDILILLISLDDSYEICIDMIKF